MKKQLLLSVLCVTIVLALLLPSISSGHAQANPDAPFPQDHVLGEVLVKFRLGVTPVTLDRKVEVGVASLDALIQQYDVMAAEPLFADVGYSSQGLERIYKLSIPTTSDVLAVVTALSADTSVEYAEPNYIYSINETSASESRLASAEQEIPPTPEVSLNAPELSDLLARAHAGGKVRVIVGLQVPFKPEGELTSQQAVSDQRAQIARVQADMLTQLSAHKVTDVKTVDFIPYMAMTVDMAALQYLASSPNVISITENKLIAPTLSQSVPLVGARAAWNQGYTGAGWAVAVLDSGVDNAHPFLAGKVVSEACYSTSFSAPTYTVTSLCLGGVPSSTLPGSGENCGSNIDGCDHGTHVAGIVAGYQSDSFAGVAPEAQIIAIQVFSEVDGADKCAEYGKTNPCALSYTFDQVLGLRRVLALADTYNIAAVNMSLGGGRYYTQTSCDNANPARKVAIDNLRSVGIATVVSSGNDGYTDSMGAPACISSAISVGATNDGSWFTRRDRIWNNSNSASFLTLLAPGCWIRSSIPNNRYENKAGTSMAAPHVAGAWAVLRQSEPLASVDQVAEALIGTGVPVEDTREGAGDRVKPRIRVDGAWNVLNARLVISEEPTYDFGVQPVGSSSTEVFTVTNRGSFAAISVSGGGLFAPFTFAGGAYPGTGGTCDSSLNSSESCTVVATFTPDQHIPSASTLTISYTASNLTGTFSSKLMLTGTGGGAALSPNDSMFQYQWALHNTGQTGGTDDADIDAPEAWGITTGAYPGTAGMTNVMVAVIDTGVDYTHEDLDDGRVRTDIDRDYVNDDDDAMDDNGHGTHVAGTIAAETDNGVGIAGVMWEAQILPLKVLNSRGSGSSDDIASAIRYAADKGADVINMSLGSSSCSNTIADAVNYAYFDKGVIVVAAAGNSGGGIAYPAKHPPVIAVGATDYNDERAYFSSRGDELDVVAPGVGIWSTVPNYGYERFKGTSMASPHVAGVAGLLLAQRSELSQSQVREILHQSADDLGESGFDPYYGYGRVNAYQALQTVTPNEPPAPGEAGCPILPPCAASVALDGERDEESILSNLRTVRDEVFTQDPGQRWARIYYEHQFEVAWLLMSDDQLRADALAGFRAFDPVFRAGLSDDEAGSPVILTPELIEAARRALMGVAERGSPAVHDDIVREWEKVDPYRFVGWDVRKVWEQLRLEEQSVRIYLPIVLR